LIGFCPHCGKPRQLVYYSNVKAYQCIVCGSLIQNPREFKQVKLSD